ncbi:DNA replication initiation control protein YabA [Streptococcus suis]|uniref:DNA replication initiation control protein YabA n=1 Tax=Streptococcus suis TaxID=1307 RepID=UPI0014782CCE
MDKKDIFHALDGFSQNLFETLAEVESIKKNLQAVIDENTALRLENAKIRERLKKEIATENRTTHSSLGNLEAIYLDGFHICNDFYGQRRDNDEPCMFCDVILNRE